MKFYLEQTACRTEAPHTPGMNETKIDTDWTSRTRTAFVELHKLLTEHDRVTAAVRCVRATGETLTAVSSHLLVEVHIDAYATNDGAVLIPGDAVKTLSTITSKSLGLAANAKLTLFIADGRAEIRTGDVVAEIVTWEPVTAEYPDVVKKIFPSENEVFASVTDISFGPKKLAKTINLCDKFGDSERTRIRFIGHGDSRLYVESTGVRAVLMPKIIR